MCDVEGGGAASSSSTKGRGRLVRCDSELDLSSL